MESKSELNEDLLAVEAIFENDLSFQSGAQMG